MEKNLSKQPVISVIMAARNVEKYISIAIESVLSQTYSNWELIIADDASTDKTAEIIEQFLAKDRRIKKIRLDTQSGQAIARNKAIAGATGTYLAILDADDVAKPTRLNAQILFLEAHQDITAVGSSAEIIDQHGKITGLKTKPESSDEIKFRLLLQTQFIHSSVCMRKDTFTEIGGYDNAYLYAEDYDLWSRFSKKGLLLANIPEPLIQYRIQPQSVSLTPYTQPDQAKRALQISLRNVSTYTEMTLKQIEKLTKLVNGYNLSPMETYRALKDYWSLLVHFINAKSTSPKAKEFAKTAYADRRRHAWRTTIKQVFKLS